MAYISWHRKGIKMYDKYKQEYIYINILYNILI